MIVCTSTGEFAVCSACDGCYAFGSRHSSPLTLLGLCQCGGNVYNADGWIGELCKLLALDIDEQ